MEQLEHYFICKRYTHGDHGWDELDSENFHVTKPTVLCFGGNGTITSKDANYMCKIAQNLVGIKEPRTPNEIATTKDVDFIGIAYGPNDTEKYTKNQDKTGALTDKEVAELANNIFSPFYFDERMKIRPKEQILKNFSLITFFSHCHGATEVQSIIDKVRENMSSVGIQEEIISDAINQLYSVTYAPIEAIQCPGLQIISQKDPIMSRTNGPKKSTIANKFLYYKTLNIPVYTEEGTVAFKENDYTISLIASSLTKDTEDEHELRFIERNNNWSMIENELTYGNEVSIAMGVALSYSITNSIQNYHSEQFIPKLKTDEMLNEIKSVLGQTQNTNLNKAIEEIREI